jgi:hypothetical protein
MMERLKTKDNREREREREENGEDGWVWYRILRTGRGVYYAKIKVFLPIEINVKEKKKQNKSHIERGDRVLKRRT